MITDTNATPIINLKLVTNEPLEPSVCVFDEDNGAGDDDESTFFLLLRFDVVVSFDPVSLEFTLLELLTYNYNVNILQMMFYYGISVLTLVYIY